MWGIALNFIQLTDANLGTFLSYHHSVESSRGSCNFSLKNKGPTVARPGFDRLPSLGAYGERGLQSISTTS